MDYTVDIGAVIRGARCTARLTQTQLGAQCGYSASAISRIESNQLRLDYQSLLRVASVLGITPDQLNGTSAPGRSAVATVSVRSFDEEDAVRRRDLLTGALAAGATVVVGSGTASAAPVPGGLEEALFRLPAAAPVPLAVLTEHTAAARAAFGAAKYADLGAALPALLASAEATRDAASGRLREHACAVLGRAYVMAAELAFKQHSDAAWVAADRALTAARASGAPVPIGEATRVLAIAMRRSGRSPSAVQLLAREAADLDATEARTGSVRTTLLLTAAYSAATGGDRSTALALLDEAQEDTERLPEVAGLYTVEATQTEVDMYRISTLNALGTPDEGVKVAGRLNINLMSTPERRARAWTDTARMWHALGDGPQTFAALRRIEAEAPQEVRRPALRALTADLLYGPARVQGLREFAVRTGALAA